MKCPECNSEEWSSWPPYPGSPTEPPEAGGTECANCGYLLEGDDEQDYFIELSERTAEYEADRGDWLMECRRDKELDRLEREAEVSKGRAEELFDIGGAK